jgi:hypothetical protein
VGVVFRGGAPGVRGGARGGGGCAGGGHNRGGEMEWFMVDIGQATTIGCISNSSPYNFYSRVSRR